MHVVLPAEWYDFGSRRADGLCDRVITSVRASALSCELA